MLWKHIISVWSYSCHHKWPFSKASIFVFGQVLLGKRVSSKTNELHNSIAAHAEKVVSWSESMLCKITWEWLKYSVCLQMMVLEKKHHGSWRQIHILNIFLFQWSCISNCFLMAKVQCNQSASKWQAPHKEWCHIENSGLPYAIDRLGTQQ